MIQYNDSIDQQLLLLRKNLREKCFDCYSSRKNKLKNDAIFVVSRHHFKAYYQLKNTRIFFFCF